MFPSECSQFWDLSNYFPFMDAINRWCEGDPGCVVAKSNALLSALADDVVKYRRVDNKKFPDDDVYSLKERNLLLVERESFYEWVKSVSNRAEQDAVQSRLTMPRRTENSYLCMIGAMIDLMLAATYGDNKRYSTIKNKAALIELITTHYAGTPGLSESNLDRKFADATRQFEAMRKGP